MDALSVAREVALDEPKLDTRLLGGVYKTARQCWGPLGLATGTGVTGRLEVRWAACSRAGWPKRQLGKG
jgi:hypothetical protein